MFMIAKHYGLRGDGRRTISDTTLSQKVTKQGVAHILPTCAVFLKLNFLGSTQKREPDRKYALSRSCAARARDQALVHQAHRSEINIARNFDII